MGNKLQLKRSAVPGKVPTTADLDLGEIAINTYDGKAYMKKNVGGVESIVLLVGAGSGDLNGPASSTDNAITRFDGISGKTVQNSNATIDDSGNLTAVTSSATGTGANKMPVGTTAQRPAGAAGLYRMNTSTGNPEWYNAANSSWVPFSVDPSFSVDYLIVAGGGGGGGNSIGGGGGAGGYVSGSATIYTGDTMSVTVGAGGTGGTIANTGTNGGNSVLGSFTTAVGGGRGGNNTDDMLGGGSGGGNAGTTAAGGAGTSGQGRAGGASYEAGQYYGAGGGGGAGAVGANGTSAGGGNGGIGKQWLDGNYYAGGGGGGYHPSGGVAGVGGNGGGGYASTFPVAGQANSGGGGGGACISTSQGANGGSGIVIVRYLGSPRGTGGTITQTGGYTYHTFTSSGTFAV